MYIKIVTIGAPQLSFAREGFSEYIKRLSGFHKVQIVHIKDSAKAFEKMKEHLQNTHPILLDESGCQYASRELATKIDLHARQGENNLTFLIGPADGHSGEMRELVKDHWSLAQLTLPHDLAMLFTAEALYRASTITAGHPYHRD